MWGVKAENNQFEVARRHHPVHVNATLRVGVEQRHTPHTHTPSRPLQSRLLILHPQCLSSPSPSSSPLSDSSFSQLP